MSNRFVVNVSAEDLAFGTCVSSGQVFRWTELEPGKWGGAEGANWYQVEVCESSLAVETNGTQIQFESLFRLDWSGFEVRSAIREAGPELIPLLDLLPGLRIMRPSSPVETLFSFLCTSNNHLSRIKSMVASLGSFGEPMEGNDSYRFPDLERIADIQESELRTRGFGYRAATIPRVAQEILGKGGYAFLDELKNGDYSVAVSRLVELPGVGPKLADCIALFALDHSEAVPIDTHIWQAATRLYFPQWKETSLTASKYREIGDFMRSRFGRYAGWAHQYMFYDNLLNWRGREKSVGGKKD